MITSKEEYLQRLDDIQNQSQLKELVMLPSDEPRFIIDSNSRTISIPDEFTFLGVENDHAAETIYFEIDRYFDQHDLSTEMCVIQFESVNEEGAYETVFSDGFYPVTKIDIDTVPGKILFGWTILNDVTAHNGIVKFSVRFYSLETNESGKKEFSYNFNTLPSSLPIKETINVTGTGVKVDPSDLEILTARFAEIEQRAKESISETETNRDLSKGYANAAEASAAKAKNSEDASKASELASKESELAASQSETGAATSAHEASDSKDAAKQSELAAEDSKNKAKISEDKALVSENNAKKSELNSKESETNSKDSELASKQSETNAKSSEVASAASETAASKSASNAQASEKAAETSKLAASTSEVNAKASETASKASEEAALASANSARESATKAADSILVTEENKNAASESAKSAANYAKESEMNKNDAESSAVAAAVSEANAKKYSDEAKKATTVDSTLSISGTPADAKATGDALAGKSPTNHTHNYAGSSSVGGSAISAVKLDTATAGSASQPVYFSGGKPVACTYTLEKSVPSDAKFTDTNTWRGVQNNLVSTATDQSLSAAQGKVLKELIDNVDSEIKTHNTSMDSHPDIRVDIAKMNSSIRTLELRFGTNVTKNQFSATFSSLDGLTAAGVWNADLARLEF